MGTVRIRGNEFEIFGTFVGAQAYLAGSLNSEGFDCAAKDQQEKALVTATRLLTDQLAICGINLATANEPVGARVVLEQAAYELANSLLADTEQSALTQGGVGISNVKSVGAGSARVEFFQPQDGQRFDAVTLRLFNRYVDLVKPTGVTALTGANPRDLGESIFNNPDEFGLDRGFP